MTARNATLVLSGGGARGAFQVGAEEVLRQEAGFAWERILGVSVGALNGTLLAQHEYGRLLEVWRTIREKDVYRKVWWPVIAFRLAVLKRAGVYDGTPLRETIRRHAAGRPFRVPIHVGRVSLVSGAYELVNNDAAEFLDAVWHSATMPIIWEPIGPEALIDGGLRNVTPLGDALEFKPTELVVINCGPDVLDRVEAPADIVSAARRSIMDIAIGEIMLNDVREFVRINSLVKQAQGAGVTLVNDKGRPYRYCPITVIQPSRELGDPLDFSQDSVRARLEAGRNAARAWLRH